MARFTQDPIELLTRKLITTRCEYVNTKIAQHMLKIRTIQAKYKTGDLLTQEDQNIIAHNETAIANWTHAEQAIKSAMDSITSA